MMELSCEVEPGLIDSERVATFRTVHGDLEEVVVTSSQATERAITVWEIGRTQDRVLIELPRESARGH